MGQIPLWVRWGVIFFLIFAAATWFRGPLRDDPVQTLLLCAVAGAVFGALAQIEQKLPGGRPKRPRR